MPCGFRELAIVISGGIAGLLMGGFLGSLLWRGGVRMLHPGGLISSVLGAMLLLWIVSRR